jgi:hypothetical protein
MDIRIDDYLQLPTMDLLDQTQVYEQLQLQVAGEGGEGLADLSAWIAEGLTLLARTRGLLRRWEVEKGRARGGEAGPGPRELDVVVDRICGRIYRKIEQDVAAYGPDSPEGRAGARLLSRAFPRGLRAHTQSSHAHQDVVNREALAVFRDPGVAEDVALLRLGALIAEFAAAVEAFHEGLLVAAEARSQRLEWAEVEAATETCHLHLLELVALTLALSRERRELRARWFGPLEAYRAARRARSAARVARGEDGEVGTLGEGPVEATTE